MRLHRRLREWWDWTRYTLGNEHGFSGGSKDEARQEDVARQREEVLSIGNQFLSQLVPGSQEYNELQAFIQEMVQRSSEGPFAVSQLGGQSLDQQEAVRLFGQQIVQQQQQRISEGGAATPLEARTNLAFQGVRDTAAFTPEEQAVFNALRGLAPGETGTPSDDIFAQLVGRAQDPSASFQSTLEPSLALLMDQVKARAASRGILGSGLELEDLGRTGAELAVREAQARQAYQQQQLQNFFNLFNVGQGLRGREIGLEEALLNLQQGRESRLTDLLGRATFDRGTQQASLFGDITNRFEGLYDEARQQESAQNAQLGQALGQLAGTAVGFAVGGPPGAAAGSTTASSLLGSQQAASQTGQASPTGSLTRQPTNTQDLLKLLQQALGGSP